MISFVFSFWIINKFEKFISVISGGYSSCCEEHAEEVWCSTLHSQSWSWNAPRSWARETCDFYRDCSLVLWDNEWKKIIRKSWFLTDVASLGTIQNNFGNTNLGTDLKMNAAGLKIFHQMAIKINYCESIIHFKLTAFSWIMQSFKHTLFALHTLEEKGDYQEVLIPDWGCNPRYKSQQILEILTWVQTWKWMQQV